MDELQKKHRQEQKDLQGRITQKKKDATKKTRKGINDECTELERQLKERQAQELAALNGDPTENGNAEHEGEPNEEEGTAELTSKLQDTSINTPQPEKADDPPNAQHRKKPNRQKARLARRAAEQEAAAAAAADEAANMTDHRAAEQEVMKRECEARKLQEKDIRSDGHCLYAAVADQLRQTDTPLSQNGLEDFKVVRRDAAKHIEQHPDAFVGFLDEPLDSYVKKVRDTAEWGGQLELSALSSVYGVAINVLQGDGRVERIDTTEKKAGEPKEIWLAYYRHHFGLGEHYNSLRKKP